MSGHEELHHPIMSGTAKNRVQYMGETVERKLPFFIKLPLHSHQTCMKQTSLGLLCVAMTSGIAIEIYNILRQNGQACHALPGQQSMCHGRSNRPVLNIPLEIPYMRPMRPTTSKGPCDMVQTQLIRQTHRQLIRYSYTFLWADKTIITKMIQNAHEDITMQTLLYRSDLQ